MSIYFSTCFNDVNAQTFLVLAGSFFVSSDLPHSIKSHLHFKTYDSFDIV